MSILQGILLLIVAITPHLGLGGGGQVASPEGPGLILDVSSHQGSISWEAVAGSGVRGTYHKLSEGEDWRDPSWGPERQRAIQGAGLLYGFYHFVRPRKRPAAREARWFARQARQAGGWGALLPALDIEVTELGPAATGRYLANLIRAMRGEGVRKMLLYASPGWWQGRVALVPSLRRQLRFVRGWVAHWGVSRPTPLRGVDGWVLHQYTASGRVPGIRGNVDINRTPDISLLRRR